MKSHCISLLGDAIMLYSFKLFVSLCFHVILNAVAWVCTQEQGICSALKLYAPRVTLWTAHSACLTAVKFVKEKAEIDNLEQLDADAEDN